MKNKKETKGIKAPKSVMLHFPAGILAAVLCFAFLCSLPGCASLLRGTGDSNDTEPLFAVTGPEEQAAVEAARAQVQAMDREPRIIATSPATAEICSRLELDLAGICSSTLSELPERYQGLPEVGTAMAPDLERLASLDPDWVLSPATLQADLQPKYEAIGTDWAFLNLRSVPGMYRSIQELGEIFGREEQAQALTEEFVSFYQEYQAQNEGLEAPRVLVLYGPARLLYHCHRTFLCGKPGEAGGRGERVRRYQSGISYCEHGGHEDPGAGCDPLRCPCPA